MLNIGETGPPNQQHFRQQTFWIDRELDFIQNDLDLIDSFNLIKSRFNSIWAELQTQKLRLEHHHFEPCC